MGLASLRRHPDAAFTSGRCRLIAADGSPVGVHVTRAPRSADLYGCIVRRPYICPPASVMFRRDALLASGGWREGRELYAVEDWELYLRLARNQSIVSRQDVVAEYRVHAGQSFNRADLMRRSIELLLDQERAHLAGDRRLERARVSALRHWRIRTSFEVARQRRERLSPAGWSTQAVQTEGRYLFWLCVRTMQRVPESRAWRRLKVKVIGPAPGELVGVPPGRVRPGAPIRRR